MSVKIIEFKPEHLEKFSAFDIYDDKAIERALDCHKGNHPTMTVVDGDVVVGVIGAIHYWRGRVEFWAVLGDAIYSNPKKISLAIGVVIDNIFASGKINRAEAHVKSDYQNGIKWIERFGFVKEGLAKNYLPDGSDAYLYGRYS